MAEVVLSDGTVHYREEGVGAAVVMLHATLHDHHDFDSIFDSIAQRFRAIAIDWPFHGESGHLGTPPSGPRLARVLEEFVTTIGLGPSVFVGNSVGGYAAAHLAIERPELVAGLVLVDTGGFTHQNSATRMFCRLMGRPAIARRLLPPLVGRYMRVETENDTLVADGARRRARSPEGAEVAACLWRSFLDPDYDLRGRALEIVAPTLVMWGAHDIVLSLKEGRAAHAAIRGSEFHQFPTGHVPFSSQPREFLEVLVPFLDATTAIGNSSRPVPTETVDG